MQLTIPTNWDIDVATLAGGVFALIVMVWSARAAYSRIMHAIDELKADMAALKARNVMADHEAGLVMQRQYDTEKNLAVVSQQITAMTHSLARIDRNLENIVKRDVK